MRQKICPADVISLCEANGQIRPLRVRFVDEEQAYCRMDIDKILGRNEIHHVGAEAQHFLCCANVEGRRLIFELRYAMRSHSWCIASVDRI